MDWERPVEALLAEAGDLAAERATLPDAIGVLQQAVHRAPRDLEPTLRLGDAWRRLPPNHDEGNEARAAAIAYGLRAVWLAPDDPDAHLALARALHRQHWFRQSIVHLERSWELRQRAETAFWMGWMLSEIGDLDRDLEWLARARELDPALPGLTAELGYACRVLELHDVAETLLRDAVRADPLDDYALVNLVLLLVATDRTAEAVSVAEPALARSDATAWMRTVPAIARWLAGDRDAAAPLLDRVVQTDPHAALGTWGTHALDLLAEIRWRAGALAEAQVMIERSAALYAMRWQRASEGWGFRLDLGRLAALQGDTPTALHWLRDAFAFGWLDVALARRDPMLEGLQGEPAFEALLDAAAARVAEQRARAPAVAPG